MSSSRASSSSTSKVLGAYLLLSTLFHVWQGAGARARARCFTGQTCNAGVIHSVNTPRGCCIDNPRGRSYDSDGQTESCHHCEVIGWKRENVYALEDSVASVWFGAVRGSPAARYLFNVEYMTNEANATIVDENHLSRIDYGLDGDMNVSVRLPKYGSNSRYDKKNTTLTMVLQHPASLNDGKFFHPHQVTLHVIVPEVGFESSAYSVPYSPDWKVPLCLSYSNTGGGYAQFGVDVSITRQDGGFSETYKFSFDQDSGQSCSSISLPPSAIPDPFTNTTFSAAIDRQDPSFDLGAIKTAILTVLTLQVPEVGFESSAYSVPYSPDWKVPLCLSYSNTDGGYAPFSVNVSITRQDGGFSETYKFSFDQDSGQSCPSISLPPSAIPDPLTDTTFSAAIDGQDPSFDLGAIKTAQFTVLALQVPQIQFDVSHTTYSSPVTSVKACLERDVLEEGMPSLSVDVSLSRNLETNSLQLLFIFAENDTLACQNITVAPAEDGHRLKLQIMEPEELAFRMGPRSSTVIVVEVPTGGGGGGGGGESGDDIVVEVADGGLGGNSNSDGSGPDAWVIAVSVALPALLLLAVIAIVIIAAILYYRHNSTSYYPAAMDSKQDSV